MRSLADELREIVPGTDRWFGADEAKPETIRSTLSRMKRGTPARYMTRPEDGGLRVWRIADATI